jgi:hypothetical protein
VPSVVIDYGVGVSLVHLIGYGAVAAFSVGDEKPPHYYSEDTVSKDGTVARIRYSRGAREAIATIVKVAGIDAACATMGPWGEIARRDERRE